MSMLGRILDDVDASPIPTKSLVSRYAINVFFKADRAIAVCGIVLLFAL